MQQEYGISKYELSNVMVNRPIHRILLAGYLTEQTGTETTQMGRFFPANLRLVYMQHIQMYVRGSSAKALIRATHSVSLAGCLQKTHSSAGVLLFQLISEPETSAEVIKITQRNWQILPCWTQGRTGVYQAAGTETWEEICPGNFWGAMEIKVACERRGRLLGMRWSLTETSVCRVLPAVYWVSVPGIGARSGTDVHSHSQTPGLCTKAFHTNMGRELPNKAAEMADPR